MKLPIDWIAFDVESTGMDEPQQALQPWSPRSRLISFAHAHWGTPTKIKGSVSADPAHDIRTFLQKVILLNTPVVGWNTAFDVAWLIKMGFGEQVKQIKWLDGMLFWRALERYPESDMTAGKRKRYGLKDAVAEFMPEHTGYGEHIDFTQANTPVTRDLLKYNQLDAQLTLAIAGKFWDRLVETNPRGLRVALLECATIPMVAEHYINGLCVDVPEAMKVSAELAKQLTGLSFQLELIGVSETVLASPAQLSRKLYDDWGLPVLSKTPKGAPSTDKVALHELSFIDDRVASIKQFRELKGLRTKFVDNIILSTIYNKEPVTHPTMRLSSTYTGRATFQSFIGRGAQKRQTGFAIHQMKRAAMYRRIITAPEGHQIVEWDAAGQEYRWMAIESGDKTMLKLCQAGGDPHSYMGAQMSSWSYPDLMEAVAGLDPEAKLLRQAGKVGNLSCQYRIGVAKLLSTARVQYGMDWKLPQAQRVYDAYHSSYRGVRKYWNSQVAKCRRQGYVETRAGRRVILNGDWSKKDKWRLESTAVNFPVQGIGADQKYLAMASLKSLITKYEGSFLFELHDGLYCVFPDEIAEEAALAGKVVLDTMPYDRVWGFTPPIPLPWDIKIGRNWGDMIEM